MDFKKKRRVILLVQIIVTLVVGFSIFNYTNNQLKPTKVYTYAKNIDDPTKEIKESDIKEIDVPSKAVMDTFETDKKNIIGKHIDRKVAKGQYVYKSELVKKEEVDIFKDLDLTQRRKISLPISYVEGFSGNIKKGDKVDLAYVGAGATEESDFNYSKVFMQDVPVWSVNTGDGYVFTDTSDMYPEGYGDENENIDGDSGDLEIITLAVTLEQAEEILARRSAGRIEFVGRFDDSTNYDSLGFVLGDYEKIFSGQGNAETGRTMIEEDGFEEMIKDQDNK